MRHKRMIYQSPELNVFHLSSTSLMKESSIQIIDGTTGAETQSKAFWGPSIFDDDEDEEILDLPY